MAGKLVDQIIQIIPIFPDVKRGVTVKSALVGELIALLKKVNGV